MKVAFISQPWNHCPPIKTGSMSVWTYEVARRLAKTCDVIVYANSNRFQKRKEYYEGVFYRRVSASLDNFLIRHLKRLPIPASIFHNPRRPFFSSGLYYLGYIVKIANDLKKQRCDIIHIQNLSQFIPVLKIFNPDVKIVLHMHCNWLAQLDRRIIEHRLNQTDLAIGCSNYITEKIRRHFPHFAHSCRTVYNGVDIKRFIPEYESDKSEKNRAKKLLFVGRITPEKGLHVLLEAFHTVIKYYPQTQVEIVGPYDRTPQEFIVDLDDDTKVTGLRLFYKKDYLTRLKAMLYPDLSGHVTFSGHIQQEHLNSNYRSADILVNPSLSESFGMSLIEAMAAGIPVIATRAGGMAEIVEDNKTGILVEPGDVPALAQAILHLLANDEKRVSMGNAGRRRVIDLFSWDQIAKSVLDQYKYINESN